MVDLMPAGRPPIFSSPEEMQQAVDNYFDNEEKPTVSGLALALGMTTETFRTYGEKNEFSATVKAAKQRIESVIEECLLYGSGAAGPIFNLKNNFGWKDKTEQETTGNVTLNVNTGIERD